MKSLFNVILRHPKLSVYIILSIILFSAFYIYTCNVKKTETVGAESPDNYWFELQRAYPFDEIPNDARLKSIDYVKNYMTTDRMNPNAAWTLAGPTNIGGRVTTIAIHPTVPTTVYAGFANAGVWKSTDNCTTWTSVFDNQNTSSIGALAIDPTNPNIIYCGTGEPNSLRSYYPGTGMFKSTNGGSTWTFIGLPNSFAIGNISINPLNTQEIYVAVLGALRRANPERGLYKSTNGGLNWTQSLYVADSVGAVDVVLDPNNPSNVFCAMWERFRREDRIKYGGPQTALYMSTNSGANWSVVNGGFPSNASDMGRIGIDIAKSNSQIIYALTAYANGNTRGLYKSTNGGTNWTLINSSAGSYSNYAWFGRCVKVDPLNPNHLFCGGLYLEYSINGGTSFSSISSLHADQHALAFAPSNNLNVVAGCDGGIYYSINGGTSFTKSYNLPVTQFYAGEVSYLAPAVLLAGAQDNGTPRTLTGNLNDWSDMYGGDGFYCLVDYTTTQRVYAESQNGVMGYSINGGSSFYSGTSGLDMTYTNWSTPFIMDKNNPLIMYTGTYKVHRSTNGMANWTVISPDLANGHSANLGTITTLDVSKSTPSVIYAGTDDANVWVTTNTGTNWTKIITGLPNRWVTRLAVQPDSAAVCYVTLSGYKIDTTGAHIFRTTNYGTSWTSVKGNLPDAPINVVVIDPLDYKTLYLGTDVGVMVTHNTGGTWSILGTGFPSAVPVHDLKLHNPTRKLVAFTHGRSALTTIVDPPVNIVYNTSVPKAFRLAQNYPNPFNPVTKIKFDIPKSSDITLKVFDITGRVVSTLVNKTMQAGSYEVTFDASLLPSGAYFYKLSSGNFSDVKRLILVK